MGRAKLPRKSTNIDMTAMCDVAFLLLSFFILATKFKPPEALTVVTPSSVSTKPAPEKDVVLVTIDKDGKVYLSVSDNNVSEKREMIESINTSKNIGLSPTEKANFVNVPNAYIGAPFSQLKSYLDKNPADLAHVVKPGIPAVDSTNNEMVDWFKAAADAFQGKKMNILVKGDDASKYPSLQGVIIALKKNDLMKFQVVTASIPVPAGTDLYNEQQKSGSKAVE
ncbi:MAG TPA: biopolymer transporter ExbD [Puia sp.]|nr:biopolymer transporter ExbD [Puia sp.]